MSPGERLRRVWRGESLVTRLVAVTVVTGLLTGVLGVLVVRSIEVRELRQEAAADNVAIAERLAALVDGRIGAFADQLELVAAAPSVAALDAEARTELAVAIRLSEDFDRLVLYDRAGRPIAAAASAELVDAGELAPRDDLVTAMPSVSVVRGGRLPALEFVTPVEDPPGRWAGTLVGEVPLDLLTEETETRLRGTGTTAFVVVDDGTIVAHRELDRVLARERFDIAEVFGGARTATRSSGSEPVLLASAPTSAFDAWIVVERPEAEALTPIQEAVSGTTAVFAAVIVAIVTAVVLLGRRLLRPLGPLAEAVSRLERGELGTRVTGPAVGEVGVLAQGFNRMAGALEERQAELEEAERAARSSEQRLRLLVEGVEDYAILLLDVDARIRSWNSGARRVFGTDADDSIGRPLTAFFDTQDPPADPRDLADGDGRGEVEGWLRRADGRRFWASIAVSRLTEEHGAPYGYAAVVHDLTERNAARRALEEALSREQEAAEELRRTNEVKDEFLAIAAHELQTPVAAILGAASMLEEAGLAAGERDELRGIIEAHAEDMRLVVERFLDFTRLQAGKIRLLPVELRLDEELAHHVRLLSRQLVDHDVTLDVPPAVVALDRVALRHIVTNLLSNAAKFSDAGSRIVLDATVDDDRITIEVHDEGAGIPEEEHERIFELFRQSRDASSSRGTGVGLAIVRRYVELLDGHISLDSTPGKGSTFRVTLPVRMSEVSDPATPSPV